jgi:glyoxylase-like metal-dependent hydrolase (beta-lactamase superfamily II)
MTFEADVAPGVHRVEDAYTNWYLLEEDQRLTVVDAGTPASWGSLLQALQRIGRRLEDIEAVVLTHAHFDHVGFAERARTELGVPVWVHEHDVPLTRHPMEYGHERSRLPYLLNPGALPIMASMLRHRAFFAPSIKEVRRFREGERSGDEGRCPLPVPGAPEVVRTPGHTIGHCALGLADRDAVIAGDAVVTLDPYTGRRGPRLVARAATADSERNLGSLDALAATGARHVLVGHGAAWHDGAEAIVEQARAAGVQ